MEYSFEDEIYKGKNKAVLFEMQFQQFTFWLLIATLSTLFSQTPPECVSREFTSYEDAQKRPYLPEYDKHGFIETKTASAMVGFKHSFEEQAINK